jgi:hypothetical protein
MTALIVGGSGCSARRNLAEGLSTGDRCGESVGEVGPQARGPKTIGRCVGVQRVILVSLELSEPKWSSTSLTQTCIT